MKKLTAHIRAFSLGVQDGWRQPEHLYYSRNVSHLFRAGGEGVHNTQDAGTNVGQVLRAGRNSQAWQLKYWPVSIFRK